MKRCAFNIVAGLSLLLSVAAAVLWVRSYWASDLLEVADNTVDRPGDHGTLRRAYVVTSSAGRLSVHLSDEEYRHRADDEGAGHAIQNAREDWEITRYSADKLHDHSYEASHLGWWRWKGGGFASGAERYRGNQGGSDVHYLTLPFWFIVVILASLGSPGLYRLHQHLRRTRLGLCLACGYDLRATPRQCPECGAAASPANIPTSAAGGGNGVE